MIDQTPGNEDLRRELDTANLLRVMADYRAKLRLLEAQYGHTIAILQEGISEIARFNCFAYAFGVWSKPIYRRLVDERQSSSLINSDFASEMIRSGDLAELPEEQAISGSVVLYFADHALRHAGVVEDASTPQTIRSKWGGNEVHRHKLWEVPACHGNRARYFSPPNSDAVLARLEAKRKND
ncbi:MAG: hypothetical protein WA851_26785 [Xanthobacteraceae bacterium]